MTQSDNPRNPADYDFAFPNAYASLTEPLEKSQPPIYYLNNEIMSELNEEPIVFDRSNSRYAPREERFVNVADTANYSGEPQSPRYEQHYEQRRYHNEQELRLQNEHENAPRFSERYENERNEERYANERYVNERRDRETEHHTNERYPNERRDTERYSERQNGNGNRRENYRENRDNRENNHWNQQREQSPRYQNPQRENRGGYNRSAANRPRYNNNNPNNASGGYRANNSHRENYRQERPQNNSNQYEHNREQRGNHDNHENGEMYIPYNNHRSGGYQNQNNNFRNDGHSNNRTPNNHAPRPFRGRYHEEQLEPTIGARGKKGEPISLAEELALEKSRGLKEPNYDECYEQLRQLGDETYLSELEKLTTQELVAELRHQDLAAEESVNRQDLIFRLLKARIKKNGLMYGEGTLEILPDEFGFLRSSEYHYLSCPDDIYVSPSQIRRFGLRNGSIVSGQIRPPKENERYFALLRVEAINHEDPNKLSSKPYFDDLTPVHPDSRIIMEDPNGDLNTRVVDLTVPVGFGQRGLIVSPPRAGKTILMQKMAKAAMANYPDLHVFMLLVDERPEEVTDMERQIKASRCEVISSTFDEPPARHIQVSEMVLDKAKRMVEYGKDVIIFLDSITRLARAWNTECPASGRTLSGGVDANALQRPKRFFGSARKVEEGGSLTIIATALVDTGSRMDDVIFEEFKGTGNLEIVLDRTLVDKRIWPAINIDRSGTRREEMLMTPEEYRRISVLRRVLNDLNPTDAMEFLTNRLVKTKSNGEFLMGLNVK